MFDTLLASSTGTGPWVRPALAAGVLHFLVVLGAVRGTATPPDWSSPEVRDTIRLELTRSEPEPPRTPTLPPGTSGEFPAPPPLLVPSLDLPKLAPLPSTSSPIDLSALTLGTQTGSPAESPGGSDPMESAFDVGEVDQPPELVHAFQPVYPEVLRQMGVNGIVRLEYLIDSTGQVEAASIRILASTHSAFSTSAIEAVRNARFKPARRSGHAVAVLARQSIRFVRR